MVWLPLLRPKKKETVVVTKIPETVKDVPQPVKPVYPSTRLITPIPTPSPTSGGGRSGGSGGGGGGGGGGGSYTPSDPSSPIETIKVTPIPPTVVETKVVPVKHGGISQIVKEETPRVSIFVKDKVPPLLIKTPDERIFLVKRPSTIPQGSVPILIDDLPPVRTTTTSHQLFGQDIPGRGFVSNVFGFYQGAEKKTAGFVQKIPVKLISGVTGIDKKIVSTAITPIPDIAITKIEKGIYKTSPLFLGAGGKEWRKFQSEFVGESLRDIKDAPLRNIVLYGAGGVLGRVGQGLSKTKVGKRVAITGGVLMTGAFAADVGIEIYKDPSGGNIGGVLGVATKDVALLSAGAKTSGKIIKGTWGGGKFVGKEVLGDVKTFSKTQTFKDVKGGLESYNIGRDVTKFSKPTKSSIIRCESLKREALPSMETITPQASDLIIAKERIKAGITRTIEPSARQSSIRMDMGLPKTKSRPFEFFLDRSLDRLPNKPSETIAGLVKITPRLKSGADLIIFRKGKFEIVPESPRYKYSPYEKALTKKQLLEFEIIEKPKITKLKDIKDEPSNLILDWTEARAFKQSGSSSSSKVPSSLKSEVFKNLKIPKVETKLPSSPKETKKITRAKDIFKEEPFSGEIVKTGGGQQQLVLEKPKVHKFQIRKTKSPRQKFVEESVVLEKTPNKLKTTFDFSQKSIPRLLYGFPRVRGKTTQIFRQPQISIQKQKSDQLFSFGSATGLKSAQTLKESFRTPTKTTFGFAKTLPYIPLFGAGFSDGIPKFPTGSVRIKRGFYRTPSFAAVNLGITSPKAGKFEFTGLVERPVLTKKRR